MKSHERKKSKKTLLGKNMKALIDGDILVYECAFGAETSWKGMGHEGVPPFDIAAELLDNRIANIAAITEADEYIVFLTGENNFREKIATIKPYKGNRVQEKPFHYKNLRAYLVGKHNGIIIDGMEADDAMSIEQCKSFYNPFHEGGKHQTIICSRDKDLRMIPGLHYGWELGNQPSFGPQYISELDGYKNFFYQCLVGDKVDNIQGLPKCGPVAASKVLANTNTYEEMLEAVREAYRAFYEDSELADKMLLENGQLLWMVRELDEDGKPIMWEF